VEQNQQQILAQRYGEKRAPSRSRVKLLSVIGVSALTLGAIGIGLANWNPIAAETIGYRVQSPWLTELDFEVQMPPGSVAQCEFEALNNSFAQVGFRTEQFGPFEQATTAHTVEINTFEEAVTGLVRGCELR